MTSSSQPEILVAHPWMGRGGSEATAMWTLNALQDMARVTFTTASPMDWDKLNEVYGTSVAPGKVKLVRAPRIPGVKTGSTLAYWQRAYFERFCQTVSRRFDVCISAYNPIHFNRAAIQLIGDFSFNEDARLHIYANALHQLRHRRSLLRTMYLSVGEQLARRGGGFVAGPGDRVVANSRWVSQVLEQRFNLPDAPVLYPPSPRQEPCEDRPRDPLGFVCMGRIAPEKEIETILEILEGVRAAGYPATLDLVGHLGDNSYSAHIRRLANERTDWVRTPGFLNPAGKSKLLSARTYGIHASRAEAFGIAVAEMAAAGLIPFVPEKGGSKEVVNMQELTYADKAEAVSKIIARIECPESHARMRAALRHRSTQFEPERFAENLLSIVDDFLVSGAVKG